MSKTNSLINKLTPVRNKKLSSVRVFFVMKWRKMYSNWRCFENRNLSPHSPLAQASRLAPTTNQQTPTSKPGFSIIIFNKIYLLLRYFTKKKHFIKNKFYIWITNQKHKCYVKYFRSRSRQKCGKPAKNHRTSYFPHPEITFSLRNILI